jgi:hypothetical protein
MFASVSVLVSGRLAVVPPAEEEEPRGSGETDVDDSTGGEPAEVPVDPERVDAIVSVLADGASAVAVAFSSVLPLLAETAAELPPVEAPAVVLPVAELVAPVVEEPLSAEPV